jgi:hypothetical protein
MDQLTAAAPRRPKSVAEQRLLAHCLFAAARACDPGEGVVSLLPYLECFPLGAFNRHVAQRIEDLLTEHGLSPEIRETLASRFRGLRDPFMPAIDELL